jgi:hypothetical protein
LWVSSVAGNTYPIAVAVDASGNVYATATFQNATLDFNGQQVQETENEADGFVVAYDAHGALRWGTAFQSSAGPIPSDITIAPNGDVLAVGTYYAPTSFGGAVLETHSDRSYLARYRSDGLYLASQPIGPSDPFVVLYPRLLVDAGNLIVQQIEEPVTRTPENLAVVMMRVLDGSGARELWSSPLANNGGYAPQIRALATTPAGFIVSSAWTDGGFGESTQTGAMEVVTYDASGTSSMASLGRRLVPGLLETVTYDSAADATGAIAYVGTFSGTLEVGATQLSTRVDDIDVFLFVVDPP